MQVFCAKKYVTIIPLTQPYSTVIPAGTADYINLCITCSDFYMHYVNFCLRDSRIIISMGLDCFLLCDALYFLAD